jgi:ribosomal protein S3/ribosomal protein L16
MGQKVNPVGLRLGVNRTWDSRWYANKGEYGKLLHEDMAIREALMEELKQAAVSKIVIERPHKKCRVTIHSARPGIVIGKKGADIEKLRKRVASMTDSEVHINIVEVRKPEIDATLVAQSIAQQLERRVAFRRAMKRAVQSAMRLGAEGIRISWRPSRRRRDRPDGMVSRGSRSASHASRRRRFRPGHRQHRLRHLRRQGLDLQGRDHGARPDGVRAPPGRGRRAHQPASRGGVSPRDRIMLQPVRTKYRKQFKGRIHGKATSGAELTFGSFGLKSLEPERVTARQIEAARRAITRHMKRAGRLWIRIFPDVPVSKKPTEVRMGKGKGTPELWVVRVKPGRIMFEIDGVAPDLAKEALRLGAAKLPVRTRVVQRIAD